MNWGEFSVWVIVLSGVIQMAGGMLWYGPLFGKPWMAAMGIDPQDSEKMAEMQRTAGPAYGASLVFALIFGYVIDVLWQALAITSVVEALTTMLALWLALTLANTSKAVLWGEMKRPVLLINSGFELMNFCLVALIATWL